MTPRRFAFTISAITLLAASGASAQQGATCGLQFDTTSYDAGHILDTSAIQHTFKFTNVSQRVIRISSPRVNTGSTSPIIAKKVYEPGEAGEVTVVFNPKNRKGPQTKRAVIETDDPVCPRYELAVTSKVTPVVWIEPFKIFFQEAKRGQGSTKTVTVTGRAPGFAITAIDGDSTVFSVAQTRSETVVEDGAVLTRVTLELKLAPQALIGTHSTTFVLRTNDSQAAAVDMTIAAAVVGDVRATPPGMLIRTFTPSTPFHAQVQLDSRAGAAFNITSLDVEGPADMNLVVDVQPSTIDGTPIFVVTLAGSTPAAPGQYRGVITVETDIPGEEPLKFNWIATVRER